MGKFHHSKKHHGDKKKSSSSRPKYDLTKEGRKEEIIFFKTAARKKLPDESLNTQNHKSIWNFSATSEHLDEGEDLSEILDDDEVTRIKRFHLCCNSSLNLQEKLKRRARKRGQPLADKSYAAREAQFFDGIKKLAQKFNRATVLVLKHTDAPINLDMHQFLNSDPIDPETKYRRLRKYFIKQ